MKSIFVLVVWFGNVVCDFQLQILHNNDLHARFAETDKFSASCPPEYIKEKKCYGGFARMRQAAKDAIEEAKKQNISSIFINAGDGFQGTPYYTLYKWRIVAPLIDSLGLDVMCLGNHEFDDGVDNLVEYLNHVKTPVVTCNLNLSSEQRLNVRNLMPSITLNVGEHQIGIVGYLTPETKILSNVEHLQIFDEIPKIREEAKRLKAKGVKIIIGLGHSGIERDVQIAEEVEELSVVVGGHSHTLLYSPKEKPPSTENAAENYPYMVTQKSGKKVPIVQAYAFAKYLGKLMVVFDDDGNVKSASGNPQLLDSTVAQDPHVEDLVESWSSLVQDRLNVVKGYTRVILRKTHFANDEYESNIINLVTNAIVDSGVEVSKKNNLVQWTIAPIAAYQNGGIRSTIDNVKSGGAITLEDLLTLLPFQNQLYVCRVRGLALKESLEYSVSKYNKNRKFNNLHYFLNYSGLKVVYNLMKPPGSRVESVMVVCVNCSTPKYEPLDERKIYSVILSAFILNGGDNFDMFSKHLVDKYKLGITDTDALISYIEKNKIVYPILDGRITARGFQGHPSAATRNTVSFFLIILVPVALGLSSVLRNISLWGSNCRER